jgi:hypothetical protein
VISCDKLMNFQVVGPGSDRHFISMPKGQGYVAAQATATRAYGKP